MPDYKGVLICGEIIEGKLAAITTELLGCGRKLADNLGEELSAVLLGSGVKGVAQEAIAFGADKVYVVDAPLLKEYQTDSHVAVMENIVKQVTPRILLLGQTSIGRDIAPRLAFRVGTVLSTDCLELSIEHERIPCRTPNKNAHIESFHRILEDDCLSRYELPCPTWFVSPSPAILASPASFLLS